MPTSEVPRPVPTTVERKESTAEKGDDISEVETSESRMTDVEDRGTTKSFLQVRPLLVPDRQTYTALRPANWASMTLRSFVLEADASEGTASIDDAWQTGVTLHVVGAPLRRNAVECVMDGSRCGVGCDGMADG